MLLRISDLSIYKDNITFNKDYRRVPLLDCFRWMFFSIKVILTFNQNYLGESSTITFYSTENQRRALNRYFEGNIKLNIFNNRCDASNFKSRFVMVFIGCLLLSPIFFLLSLAYFGSKRYAYYISVLLLYIVLFISFLKLKNKSKLVVSNDHTYFFRALINSNDRVIYVQHGAIGQSFPPLDSFERVYLDNKFSLKRYPIPKSNVQVICGRESVIRQPKERLLEDAYILIFINNLRCFDKLEELLVLIKSSFSNEIQVRLHPSIESIDIDKNIRVFRAADLPLKKHIEGAFFCISGTSTVVIDCARLSTPIFYYELDDYGDAYGFQEHCLIQNFSSAEKLNFERASKIVEILNDD